MFRFDLMDQSGARMSFKLRILIPVGLALAALIFSFQNCSGVQFTQPVTSGVTSVSGNPDVTSPPSGTPVAPLPTPPPTTTTVCDPFSSGSTCAPGQGLRGPLYYLSATDSTSPRAKIGDIIANGLRAPSDVVMSQIDVPARSWTDGFPGPSGLIMNTDGTPLVEWFALDLNGSIRLGPMAPSTDYQFALFSDDGSILDIDGKTVIDFDGQHSPQWKCATARVTLSGGDLHPIRLRYFQGPRTMIALRLLWRPWSQQGSSCDDLGGFSAVPSAVLLH